MKKIAIIGSGLGGLLSGCLLAKKGHEVTLFERHVAPGGYTSGFWRKGFYFESGTLSLEGEGKFFNVLKELGLYDKLTFIQLRARHIAPSFDRAPETYEEMKKALFDAFPQEKEALTAYFSIMDKVYFAFSKKSLKAFYYLLRYSKVSGDAIRGRFFNEKSILYKLLKSFTFGYKGAPLWLEAASLDSLFHDYWSIKGGMQTLADLLVETFKASGGDLKLSTPVERIVTEKGKVKGVIAKGNFWPSDSVIAACDYKSTFLKLLDDTSKIEKEKISSAEVSEAVFTVYLGLKLSNDALKSALEQPLVSIIDEKENDFFIASPSLMSPELAPNGKSSLMLMTLARKADFEPKEQYRLLKEKRKEELITQASSLIPHLRENIELSDAATPETYERYTQNSMGATSSWSWDVTKNFYDDRFPKVHVKTPIKNLYIGSCWASPFGGIPGTVDAACAVAKKG